MVPMPHNPPSPPASPLAAKSRRPSLMGQTTSGSVWVLPRVFLSARFWARDIFFSRDANPQLGGSMRWSGPISHPLNPQGVPGPLPFPQLSCLNSPPPSPRTPCPSTALGTRIHHTAFPRDPVWLPVPGNPNLVWGQNSFGVGC